CRIRITGPDAPAAHAALGDFVTHVLPGFEEPAPIESAAAYALPYSLRQIIQHWHSGAAACPGIGQGRVVIAGRCALPADFSDNGESRDLAHGRVRGALAALRADLESRLAARPSGVEAAI